LSFSQNNALTPLAPYVSPPPSLLAAGLAATYGYRPAACTLTASRYGRLPPLQAGRRLLRASLGRGLAVGGRPCMGAGCGRPPLLLVAFTTKRSKNA
ncbi:hypothetical protein BHE74_00040550, partial [Ensete ventricosum]